MINAYTIDPIMRAAINSPRFATVPPMSLIPTNLLAIILLTPMGENLEKILKKN